MEMIDKTSTAVTVRFSQAELSPFSDPIIKNAENFGSRTLDLANILKEQAYRMKNDFHQPPHAFGD